MIGRGIEQEYRDRLTTLRSQSEQESEVLLQQVERERAKLREEVEVLRTQENTLQEEVCNATQVTELAHLPIMMHLHLKSTASLFMAIIVFCMI